MNKSIRFVCLLTLLMVIPSAAVADFQRTKIAVLDFKIQGKGYETADMGQIVAEWLITAFVKEGRFDVIERRLLEKILGEQQLGATGMLDQDSVSKLGKLLGVKVVISGSVMRFQNVIEVNARIIDVESASIIAAESVKDTSAIGLEKLVVSMAQKIIKDFPLEGYIVHRTNNVVSIDLGKHLGVKPKMQFVVYKEGAAIKHPTTGEILDVETIETGIIEIITSGSKISKAIIIREQSPNTIAYGQRVKSVDDALEKEALKKAQDAVKTELPEEKRVVASLLSSDYEVLKIRFFEGGKSAPKSSQRIYQENFDKKTSRYIYMELRINNLQHKSKEHKHDLVWFYYNPDGSLRGRLEGTFIVKSKWRTAWRSRGWGWSEPGKWPVGTYRVKLFVDKVLVGDKKFSIIK